MLMAKIVDNQIVEYIDTDNPEDFPDFVEIPEHVPSNADVRFFHEDWTPKTEQELLDEGLIEPEPEEPEPEPEEPEPEPEEPEPTAEEQARWKRDDLLHELDAIVSNPLRWAEYDEPTKQALADYRQALLDVPQQEGFPDDIVWPTFPEEGEPNQSYVPTAVSRRQGRLALLNAGKLDDVEAAIDAIADPAQKRAAQIEFEADTWERSNPFLQQLWTQLGGTEQELDDLFRLGATL